MGVDVLRRGRPSSIPEIIDGCCTGAITAVAIFMDCDSNECAKWLQRWIQPDNKAALLVVTTSVNRPEVNQVLQNLPESPRGLVQVVELEDWNGGELTPAAKERLVHCAVQPQVVISAMSYDACGEYVKIPFEQSIEPLLRHWQAVYLIHDLAFGFVRIADPDMIRDRLIKRPQRLWWYRLVANMVGLLALLYPLPVRRGWKTIKNG